ncbi:glycosyltransferase family 39 protein [Chloroflexota bacterium]
MQDPDIHTSPDLSQDVLHPAPRRGSTGRFRDGFYSFFHWFTFRGNITVCIIALTVFILHLVVINNPPQPAFDEEHYVPEARLFLNGEGMNRSEHPPLAKWFIASGMFIFGDNATGWRFPSVLFGTASIFLFYLICVKLTRRSDLDEPVEQEEALPMRRGSGWFRIDVFVPVLATSLFAFENLSFVQSHVAMLDVFSITLMLLGFLLYLRGRHVGAGIVLGLSMLAKSMAVLAIVAVLVHWIITRRKEIIAEVVFTFNTLWGRGGERPPVSDILRMIGFIIAVPAVWFGLIPLLEYPATHVWANPLERTWSMLGTHISLSTNSYTAGIATTPWRWLYFPEGIFYWYTPHYVGSVSWTIWALIIPSMGYLAFEIVKRKLKHAIVALFALSWFFGVYILLIPLELATNRLMYIFYIYPAIPPVTLAIAWAGWRLWGITRWRRKGKKIFLWGLMAYLLGSVVVFFLMSPYGSGVFQFPQA